MDNVYAFRLSEAVRNAKSGGDMIDHGWSILKELHAKGFEVIVRNDPVNQTFDQGKSLNMACGLSFTKDTPHADK